jgi:ring-1,2-phenylacetyl-CoA epoxidase subunit PaaD
MMDLQAVWQMLDDIKDPEIPTLGITDLGMVRQVAHDGRGFRIEITPTFASCPALLLIQQTIEARLKRAGVPVEVVVVLDPPWTTDWITPEGRTKLRQFGLASPARHGGDLELALQSSVTCPYCGSKNTMVKNTFGSTLCRMIHFCNQCQQPFEAFKPI